MTPHQLPSVSAVIPAFNSEMTLRLAVASAVSQDLKPRETLVVDDGSNDGTLELVQRLSEVDPTVRLVRRDQNGGPAAARRTGVHAATADLIAFLDADDIWLPGKLSRQVALFEDSGVDVVHGGKVNLDQELNPVRLFEARVDQNEFEDFLCWRNLPCAGSTLVARRESMTDDLFRDDLPAIEDWAMIVQLALRHRVAALPDPVALYRVHPSSRSQSLDAHVDAGHRVLARIDEWGVDRRLRRRAYAAFYVMLCGGALRLGDRKGSLAWGMRAIARDPRVVARLVGAFSRRSRDGRLLTRSGITSATVHEVVENQLAALDGAALA